MKNLASSDAGSGPLLERDYWAVIEGCRLRPSEICSLLARRFRDFAPEEIVRFWRADGGAAPLQVGDELEVEIRRVGRYGVRIVHRDTNSLTIATLEGHPEVGRITLGSYPNDRGDIVFHIRSRARAGSRRQYLGFLAVGDPMQTNTWVDFIDRLAVTVGEGVRGAIHAEKRRVREERGDRDLCRPTFIARGE